MRDKSLRATSYQLARRRNPSAEIWLSCHGCGSVRPVTPCERLYVLSIGSANGNNHVHWHLAPLPPGVPKLMQQCRAYEELLVGRLDIPDPDYERLAEALRSELHQDS